MPLIPLLRTLLPVIVLVIPFRGGFALEPLQVADDVYAFIGDAGEINAANQGFVANAGFIVGADGIIVIDSGISCRHGQQMLDAIARISDKPVRLLINTHAKQEFLFGNAAFAQRDIPIMAHAKSVDLMRSRCDHCLENLRKILGEATMAGSRVVLPQRTIESSTTMIVAGRDLALLHFGWAGTAGDVAVFDRASGVLFAGGLVNHQRIPELRDGNFSGWLQALDELSEVPATLLIPGYGPPMARSDIASSANYLRALDARVRELYQGGTSLLEAVDRAVLPVYADWRMYPTLHRQNVLHRYLQIEVEDLDR